MGSHVDGKWRTDAVHDLSLLLGQLKARTCTRLDAYHAAKAIAERLSREDASPVAGEVVDVDVRPVSDEIGVARDAG